MILGWRWPKCGTWKSLGLPPAHLLSGSFSSSSPSGASLGAKLYYKLATYIERTQYELRFLPNPTHIWARIRRTGEHHPTEWILASQWQLEKPVNDSILHDINIKQFSSIRQKININWCTYQLGRRDIASIKQLVAVSCLPCALNEYPVIWAHATVHHTNLVSDLFYLKGGVILIQNGLLLLFSGQDDAIRSLNILN